MPRIQYDDPQAETAFQAAFSRAQKQLAGDLAVDAYSGKGDTGPMATAAASQAQSIDYQVRKKTN